MSAGIFSTTVYGLACKSTVLTCSHRTTPVVCVLSSNGICKGNLLSVFVIGQRIARLVFLLKNPLLIKEAAQKYGDQCVVLSVDVKRVDGQFRVFAKGGRENTGMDAIEWIRRGVDAGAGEIVLNSIDTDGVKGGFDLEMLQKVCEIVKIPVIASGGCGKLEHFAPVFNEAGADAALAASVFHFGEL